MIGIAEVQCAFGHTVKAREQDVGGEVERRKPGFHRCFQRVQISGIVVIGRQETQRRLPAQRSQMLAHGIDHRRRRRGAILGIKRRDQYALASGGLQRIDRRADRRFAVPHRIGDPHRFAEYRLQGFALPARDRGERGSFVGPDLGVGVRRFFGPRGQDDAAQDRLPQ
jgi:hypothetical protein